MISGESTRSNVSRVMKLTLLFLEICGVHIHSEGNERTGHPRGAFVSGNMTEHALVLHGPCTFKSCCVILLNW